MAEAAIVIRSYNEASLLGRCLEAVLAQVGVGYEIILVDSGSTDQTLAIAGRHPTVRILKIAKRDFTYGRALNLGFRAAASDTKFVACLSAHAIPTSSAWLRNLLRPLREIPDVAGCYGRQVPLPEHLSNRFVRHLARMAYPTYFGEQPFLNERSNFFSNSNSAIRYECWSETPFDETIAFAEDAQWAGKVMARGWKTAYVPDACVLHSHPDSLAQFWRRYRDLERSRITTESEPAHPLPFRRYARQLLREMLAFARTIRRQPRTLPGSFDTLFFNAVTLTISFWERRKLGRTRP